MDTPSAPYETIVVGTDGSPPAAEAVRHATAMARSMGARLHLVCAAARAPAVTVDRGGQSAPPDVEHLLGTHEGVTTMLERLAGPARSVGLHVECHAALDLTAVDAILGVARRVDADLIVVGNRGMTGLARVLGSVPNAISHHAPCSVTIVRTVATPGG